MRDNIILVHDLNKDETDSLRNSLSASYRLFPYLVDDSTGRCVVPDSACHKLLLTNCHTGHDHGTDSLLLTKLKRALREVESTSKAQLKEKFLDDLQKARLEYKGDCLKEFLRRMRSRLDDPDLISPDIILNMLLSYRKAQDYSAMVGLVEELKTLPHAKHLVDIVSIQNLYAFALNRRNRPGDRKEALEVILRAVQRCDKPVPDMLSLVGRIYKDMFTDSDYTDTESLAHATEWYRKGFEVQPNEYSGINLATLLVVSGQELSSNSELQRVALVLNNLIGKKGSLRDLKDYWDVATFFEISVLAENYNKACVAAECMFKLDPPAWHIKSTINNIQLINRFRQKKEIERREPQPAVTEDRHKEAFHFWVDFFNAATTSQPGGPAAGSKDAAGASVSAEGGGDSSPPAGPALYHVLVQESDQVFQPSYLQLNLDAEPRSLALWYITGTAGSGVGGHAEDSKSGVGGGGGVASSGSGDWFFPEHQIRRISLAKKDPRGVYLFVLSAADDFHLLFPSEHMRKLFYNSATTTLLSVAQGDEDLEEAFDQVVEFDYELDDRGGGGRKLLGRGTFGTVYAGIEKRRQMKIAIKEINEDQVKEVQALHEEIRLHSRLNHRNIVRYLGSMSEAGIIKIFMEQVPGGSLSSLLKKNGPLSEQITAYYSYQILEGLQYLHDNKIVHRDIKGDNILVNTYSGVLKISDFGTSRRLVGMAPAATFTGTIQYMSPEVIDLGIKGYGLPADVWSFGCTVIEMLTGQPPFIELGSVQATMFKVGFYKVHPDIPEASSKTCSDFCLQSFAIDPNQRATCAQLLAHDFLAEAARLLHRKRGTNRGISRTDQAASGGGGSGGAGGGGRRHPHHLASIDVAAAHAATVTSASATVTPTSACAHNAAVAAAAVAGSASAANTPSPPSSSAADHLLSPFISDVPSSSGSSNTSNKFFLLRKDSERRETLHGIMLQDWTEIVQRWIQLLGDQHCDCSAASSSAATADEAGAAAAAAASASATINVPDSDLLAQVLRAFAAYIKERQARFAELEDAMRRLVSASGYRTASLAVYSLGEAVTATLRRRHIQPHWVFALDSILRDAIEAAARCLPASNPAAAADAAAGDGAAAADNGAEDEDALTSGVSTYDSRDASGTAGARPQQQPQLQRRQSQQQQQSPPAPSMAISAAVNSEASSEHLDRLRRRYSEATSEYARLLERACAGRLAECQQLRLRLQSSSAESETAAAAADASDADTVRIDPDMAAWAEREARVSSVDVAVLALQDFDLETLLLCDKEDLSRAPIRGGAVVRLWQAILRHRASQQQQQQQQSSSEAPGNPGTEAQH
ncbi:hypothetical protein BOX15_Mlig008352g1 [Macrostomum lignano]|uniref:Protein kinase domain-containing protein n=1 Tax=Macrostomum lignano TaxID=282301 RepID=A0A267EDE8_9PLAT|nr:hypothetical protein BOX15_Mlig008352g1 [Macrostomum lignano]